MYTFVFGICLFFLVLLAILFIVFLIYGKGASAQISISPCDVGECATNLADGTKRCPQDPSAKLYYDPVNEVCNKKLSCDNPQTPYEIGTDGGTATGSCNGTNICGCSMYPRCPVYIQSSFISDGKIFEQLASYNNAMYPRPNNKNAQPVNEMIYSKPPLILPIPTNELSYSCSVTFNDMLNSTPGCNANDAPLDCMNRNILSSGRPCSRGYLAYILDDASTFDSSDLSNLIMGCVSGKSCTAGSYYVFDKMSGEVKCVPSS